jgi:hypothetical protein
MHIYRVKCVRQIRELQTGALFRFIGHDFKKLSSTQAVEVTVTGEQVIGAGFGFNIDELKEVEGFSCLFTKMFLVPLDRLVSFLKRIWCWVSGH